MTTYAVYGDLVEATRAPQVISGDRSPSLITITPGLNATYDAAVGRVKIAVGGLSALATYAVVDRSTNGSTWTTIRGGAHVTVIGGGDLLVYDYEFPTTGAITYRVRVYS